MSKGFLPTIPQRPLPPRPQTPYNDEDSEHTPLETLEEGEAADVIYEDLQSEQIKNLGRKIIKVVAELLDVEEIWGEHVLINDEDREYDVKCLLKKDGKIFNDGRHSYQNNQ